MNLIRTDRFKRDFKDLPEHLQRRTEQALRFLVQDLRYPSLHTKRIRRTKHLWEARVTEDYRLVFRIKEDAYVLYGVGPHEILDRISE